MRVEVDPEATRLIKLVTHAMCQAGLSDAAEALADRVVRTGRLVEAAPGTDRLRVAMRLRPYAELVLREAVAIATSTAEVAAKARVLDQVLTLAGY